MAAVAKIAAAVGAGAIWEAAAATEGYGMRRKGEWLLIAEVHAAALIHVSATRRVAAHWCSYGVAAAPPHLMATDHLKPEFCACSNATRRATSSTQQTREDACKSCDTYLGTERVKALIHTCPILEGIQTFIYVVYKKCAPPTGSNCEQTQTPAWAILRLRLRSRQHGLTNPLPGHFRQLEGVLLRH